MTEIIRKSLIITLCMMAGKVLHLSAGVFVLLFGVVLATTCFSNNIIEMGQRLWPTVTSSLGAMLLNQFFAEHPFIIWTLSVIYFDHVRRQCSTNMHAAAALLPMFIVIFIDTYANSAGMALSIPEIFRDISASAVIAILIACSVNIILPAHAPPARPPIVSLPVNGFERLKMLLLVGGGLAFLMTSEVISAVFCLVPMITAVMQPTNAEMKKNCWDKGLSQVGGCVIAIAVALLLAGTQVNLLSYALVTFALVLTLFKWTVKAAPADKAINADAIMGILIPCQLFIGKWGNDFGLSLTLLRAVELIIALAIVHAIAHWLMYLVPTEQPASATAAKNKILN
ncbi:DUF2955 domain-containing protein [Veronia pacifica]|uniref:DUF2955 domain-containing protein n=1 Tax=Veronia pacifica TaxID=1080227 RepID=A0A1C3E9B9_9GAMM|nr:DUF2955 domain-containing protein [Veronia pacifica]ODA29811.1 hypothetical protein A8L45_21670 [Veronia pacifica]